MRTAPGTCARDRLPRWPIRSPVIRARLRAPSNGGTQYLRYDDAIVSVGADGTHPCSIRVEDLAAGYSHGSFIFLGPGLLSRVPVTRLGRQHRRPGWNQMTFTSSLMKGDIMYLAVELGTIDLNPVLKGAARHPLVFPGRNRRAHRRLHRRRPAHPGKLRQLVFVDRRPNAVVLACANYIALAAVIISAITNSYSKLGQGLVGVAVYGIIGVVLQGIAMLSPCTSWSRATSMNTSTSPSCTPPRSPWP